jgi:hypothetical protein
MSNPEPEWPKTTTMTLVFGQDDGKARCERSL